MDSAEFFAAARPAAAGSAPSGNNAGMNCAMRPGVRRGCVWLAAVVVLAACGPPLASSGRAERPADLNAPASGEEAGGEPLPAGPSAPTTATPAPGTAVPLVRAPEPDLRGAGPGLTPPGRPVRLTGPTHRVAFLGDSLIADLRLLMPDLRPNDVVPEIELALQRALGGVTVENLGRPGQSLVYVREDFRHHDPGITTLTAAVRTFFADRPEAERPHLVVIATTGIDIAVMSETPIELLTPVLLDALDDAVEYLAGLGVQAVVLPIFPLSAELLDRPAGAAGDSASRVDFVNRQLWESGLPVLFERFWGLDVDGVPGADPSFYARSADDQPDDGIHPGPTGRQRFADNVVDALLPLLIEANSSHPDPPSSAEPTAVHDA